MKTHQRDYGKIVRTEEGIADANHPGNVLRHFLTNTSIPDLDENILSELFLTATKTGVFDRLESITREDALTVARIVKVAQGYMPNNPASVSAYEKMKSS